MDISTGSWFEYLREEVLTEGLRDIGLPENIVDFIENAMPNAPEKSKMYAGNQWKTFDLNRGYVSRPQEFWVNFMGENFEDQIQVNTVADGGIVARTITPYRVNRDVGPQNRVGYDDETIEQNKKIAFVVQNVKAAIAKPCGTWRKSFMKALKSLSKSGVPSEKVEAVKEFLQEFTISEFRRFWNSYDELFSWLNDEPTNYEMIKNEDDLNSAYNIAKEDLLNREDPEQVIHQFDDGSYWYNLDVSNCPAEGERMGHCGGDTRGVLVSLRKRQAKRKASSSYVTMTWDDETLYQIKGRNNDAPPDEMWDHIDWFIKKMGITSVEEAGEHSNDFEGFQEMNDYLSTRNRDVNFTGQIDEAAIQEAVDEVVNDYEGENSSIYGEVNGPDDHGGEGVYVYMNADCNIQIDLGWKGFRAGNNEFRATLGPDDGTPDERFETIPQNTWGTTARDFTSEVDLDELGYDLPGEGEVEWEVQMLTGAQPDDEDIDPNYPATAHLIVSIRTMEQEPADDEDDAARNMRYFSESVIENFEDVYEELKEKLRSQLAEGGYSAKTPFDRERQGMGAMELDNWKIWQDGPKMEFWFRRGQRDDSAVLNSGGDLGAVPNVIKMWGFDPTREGHMDGIYRKMFGSPSVGRPMRIENDDLSRNMARNLEKLYSAEEAPAAGQQPLALGAKYEAPAASIVLAKDSRFIIMPETTLKREQYPTMLLNWKYEIGVNSQSSPEEVEVVKDIVKYFNEHPDMVEEAAAETIRSQVQGHTALANATKADVMSGKWPQRAIQHIDSQYGGRAASGSDEWAERVIMIAKWIKENFDQMGEVEKWVAWYKFLKPLKEGYFNHARDSDIEMDDSANTGRPESWKRKVQDQMKMLGTYGPTVRDYAGVPVQEPVRGTLGEPQAVGESVAYASKDDRDRLIDEVLSIIREKDSSYDLRIYQILIKCAMSKSIGGVRGEIETEIRGVDGVTVVSGVTYREDLHNWFSTLKIKFELLGQQSREEYMKIVLLPGLLKIKGFKIMPGGLGKIEKISRNVNEVAGFHQSSAGAASAPHQGPFVPTPKPSIQDLIDAWVASGERIYDIPTDNNINSYHTMVDIDELWTLITSPFYRNTTREFDSVKKNIINHGSYNPIVVAVGKNGRAKITSGIDIVFAAKDLGLRELPTIFMYQNQV